MIRSRRPASAVAIVLVAGIVGLTAIPAWALAQVPDTGVFVLRGKAYALAETTDHATIYVGGKFSRASDQSGSQVYFPTSIARFDEASGQGDPTFTPQVWSSDGSEPGKVNDMALSPDGSTLYVAGKFATACPSPGGSGCVDRKNLVAFDTATGAVLPLSLDIANQVDAILLGTSGGLVTKIYLGGPFKRINGMPEVRLAALNPDGTPDETWTPEADGTVRTLVFASDGQTIFAGGNFTSITQGFTTYPRQSIARLNLDGTVNDWAVPAGLIPSPMTAWSLSPTPTVLFGGLDQKSNFAEAFRLDDGAVGDRIWIRHTPGNVEGTALAPDGTHLFISGHFGTAHKTHEICPGAFVHGVGELNMADGTWVCWAPHLFPDSLNFTGGWRMLVNPTQLWLVGNFDQICSPDETECVPVKAIARFTL